MCGQKPEVKVQPRVMGRTVGTYVIAGCSGKCAFVEVRVNGTDAVAVENAKRKAVELWNKNAF